MNPYINASIIMQLMTGVIPSLQALQREGEYGRNKINQYTRYLSVPMALLQAYGFLALLNSQGADHVSGFDLSRLRDADPDRRRSPPARSSLMWLGELITEKGIGNGISFIIFAGIVSQVPTAHPAASSRHPTSPRASSSSMLGVAAVAVIIYIQEGQRRIPIQYASRVRGRRMYQGGSTFLPLRVNQAGVIPIIFAVSILLFPSQIAQLLHDLAGRHRGRHRARHRGRSSRTRRLYAILYFLLTVGFTYFYTAFTFKPDETAEQLRKNGGFIPGIRPGRPTQDYLARVVFRITDRRRAVPRHRRRGAVRRRRASCPTSAGCALGGTGLLIVVSVVVETMKQLEAQLMMRNYEGFIR